jgi:hypothetical protein
VSAATGRAARGYVRSLGEAVILQAIEDLWNPACKGESHDFFDGEGFVLCSELAGITHMKQLTVLGMLSDAGFQFDHHDHSPRSPSHPDPVRDRDYFVRSWR